MNENQDPQTEQTTGEQGQLDPEVSQGISSRLADNGQSPESAPTAEDDTVDDADLPPRVFDLDAAPETAPVAEVVPPYVPEPVAEVVPPYVPEPVAEVVPPYVPEPVVESAPASEPEPVEPELESEAAAEPESVPAPESRPETTAAPQFSDVVRSEADAEPTAMTEIVPPVGAIDSERAEYSPFRSDDPIPEPLPTTQIPVGDEAAGWAQADLLAQERAERKAARERALGNIARTPEPEPTPQPVVRTTDKFFASFGLFLLRLVLAAIFGIRAIQHFTDLPGTADLIGKTWIPEPSIMAIVLCAGELLIALGLLFGLATRGAGAGIAIIAVAALVFVYWGVQSPFVSGQPGFVGEYELVLAAVGILFVVVGGGGWSFDRRFRRNRQVTQATGDR